MLDFESFIKNTNPNDMEKLTEIWNSDYVELFCCRCYIFNIKYQPCLDMDEFSYY
ncbi:MAG: hypothetical protein ACXAEX_07195 [Promethearchaeota archaeon]|jgi:hypothetical protein